MRAEPQVPGGLLPPATLRRMAVRPPKRSRETTLQFPRILALAAAHLVLGLALDASSLLATLHAFAVLGLGIRLVASPATAHHALSVCAYLAGADVLWRMTGAHLFWEFGKYAAIILLALVYWQRRRGGGLAKLAVLYFLLLMPSVPLTIAGYGFSFGLRSTLAFILAGHAVLAMAVIAFSTLSPEPPPRPAQILMWMSMPAFSIFALALKSTLGASSLQFGNYANVTTSGGYGPNQVSSVLSLGVLTLILLALNMKGVTRWGLLGLAAALQAQSLLTFSRGGTFNLVVALALLGVHYLRDRRLRGALLAVAVAASTVIVFVVLPRLSLLTAGGLERRFSSTDTTGRRSLAESDLQVFQDNWLLGVGPGMAQRVRETFRGLAPHTEFSRLLSEHGIFGASSLLVLGVIALLAYRRAPTLMAKGWVACFIGWSLAAMAHTSLRIVSIPLLIGLATFPFHRFQGPASSQARVPTHGRNLRATPARRTSLGPPRHTVRR